jgi:hypothetical protein
LPQRASSEARLSESYSPLPNGSSVHSPPGWDQSERTRSLLLVAALNDSEDVNEVLRADSVIAGEALGFDLLEPAAAAAIIDLDLQTIRFRHPLIRSAVNQTASVSQRLQAHDALAEIFEDQPDRRVWHRAALISGKHEDVAVELEEAASRAGQRGAVARRRASTSGAWPYGSVEALRDEGRLRHLPRILMLYANMAARLADWDVAIPAAAESRRLAEELADPQAEAAAYTAVSLIAGMRGDKHAAEQAAAQAERVAVPRARTSLSPSRSSAGSWQALGRADTPTRTTLRCASSIQRTRPIRSEAFPLQLAWIPDGGPVSGPG